jgi:hypothetical protein
MSDEHGQNDEAQENSTDRKSSTVFAGSAARIRPIIEPKDCKA